METGWAESRRARGSATVPRADPGLESDPLGASEDVTIVVWVWVALGWLVLTALALWAWKRFNDHLRVIAGQDDP